MKKTFTFLLLTVILFSCKKNMADEQNYEDELQDNVVLIKEETKSKIVKLNGNVLIVKGTSGYAREIQSTQDLLKVGTVLVCEPIPNIAPEGIFNTVIDIQPNTDTQYGAGYNNVTLAPAYIEDYIKNTKGYVTDNKTFIAEQVIDEIGVTHSIGGNSVELVINKQITQNFGTQSSVNFKVSGTLKFEKDIRLGLKVRKSKIENFKFEIVNKDIANVKVEGEYKLATKKEWELCKIKGSPIEFLIGSIPVWVTPVFTVKFKLDANGKAGFNIEVIKFEKEYSNGIEYSNGSWKKIDVSTPINFTPLQVQLFLEGEAKLNLEAVCEGKFYNGLISCGVNGSLYRKLKNRIQSGEPTKCDWILGAEVGLSIKSSVFSKDLIEFNYNVYEWEFKRDIIDLLTTPPNTISSGLIAYYPFNENANDESGNNQNGTVMNTPSFTSGVSGKGVNLTGRCTSGHCEGEAGDHILIPVLNFDAMASFSINIWVKEDKLEWPDGEAYISYGSDQANIIQIGHYGNQILFSSSQGSIVSTAFLASNLNSFQMYTMVFDNGTLYAYQNGVLVGTKSNAIKAVGGNYGAIARHWGVSTYTRFTGVIDQVRIYNKKISQTEISNLYTLRQ